MKRILVPTDFSDLASYALDLAAVFAKKDGGEILLMNVIEYPVTSTFNVMGINAINNIDNTYIVEIIDRIKDQLEKIRTDLRYKDVYIKTDVKIGSAFRSIAEEINKRNVDLVIMGTKGVGGMEGTLIGSNTEKVVRLANCPVLTLKNALNVEAVKDIVFATNLVEDQEDLIAELKKLQKMFNARLHIVKVNTPNHFETDRTLKKQLKDFATKYNLEDYTLNIYNHKQEEDGIIYFADDMNADLIALGTHGRTGIMHLISGSIAEDVVNHAKRPVWTFKLKK